MKSTGVVRRIDELGRIVIPKEIRRSLGIKDGESLDISVNEDNICISKVSRMLDVAEIAKKLCTLANDTMNLKIIITDREKVIASSSGFYNNAEINSDMSDYIQYRRQYLSKNIETKFQFGEDMRAYFLYQPIITSLDCSGLIIIKQEEPFSKEVIDFARFLANAIVQKIDI